MSQYRKAMLFPRLRIEKEYTPIENKTSDVDDHVNPLESLYVKEINRYELLEKDDEYQHIQKSQAGNLASRDHIVASNLRLVFRIARRYLRVGVSLMDLVAEGNFGLLHAIEKFDVSKNHRFSTYAAWWVQHYIESYLLNYTRIVRLPIYISKKISKIKKQEKDLSQKEMGSIRQGELCEQMGMDFQTFDHLNILSESGVYSIEHFQNSENSENAEEEQEEYMLAAFETNEDCHVPQMQKEYLVPMLLKILNAKEYDVVIYRLGLCKNPEMTFESIAQHLNLSKEQVRSLYQKALKKMTYFVSKEKQTSSQLNSPFL